MNLKIKIITHACQIWMRRGEQLEKILLRYPALSKQECDEIRAVLAEEKALPE